MCGICDDSLIDAVFNDHMYACDDVHGCDIAFASENNCHAWAAHLLSDAAECPETTAAIEQCIERHGAEAWEERCDEERDRMAREQHDTCPHCNAVAWDSEDLKDCPSCGKSLDRWYVIPFAVTGEDDYSWDNTAIFRARNREIAEGGEHDFGSFESVVLDGDERVWGKRIADEYSGSSFERSDAGYVYNSLPCDCGDDGCEEGNHDSRSVALQWDASGGWQEFPTKEAAIESLTHTNYVVVE